MDRYSIILKKKTPNEIKAEKRALWRESENKKIAELIERGEISAQLIYETADAFLYAYSLNLQKQSCIDAERKIKL